MRAVARVYRSRHNCLRGSTVAGTASVSFLAGAVKVWGTKRWNKRGEAGLNGSPAMGGEMFADVVIRRMWYMFLTSGAAYEGPYLHKSED